MDKEDAKNFLKKTELLLKDLGHRGSEIAKSIRNDATYGTKAGLLKAEQLTMENEKQKLLTRMGEKTYSLIRRKQVSHKSLEELYGQIKDVDNRIRGKKVSLSVLKKKKGANKTVES